MALARKAKIRILIIAALPLLALFGVFGLIVNGILEAGRTLPAQTVEKIKTYQEKRVALPEPAPLPLQVADATSSTRAQPADTRDRKTEALVRDRERHFAEFTVGYRHLVGGIGQAWSAFDTLSLKEGLKRHQELSQECKRVSDQYWAIWKTGIYTYTKADNLQMDRMSEIFQQLRDDLNWFELELFIRERDWMTAAWLSRRSLRNWELEVYCLRQLGADGKKQITLRSIGRNWGALKRSVLSLGPYFEPPHLEPGD